MKYIIQNNSIFLKIAEFDKKGIIINNGSHFNCKSSEIIAENLIIQSIEIEQNNTIIKFIIRDFNELTSEYIKINSVITVSFKNFEHIYQIESKLTEIINSFNHLISNIDYINNFTNLKINIKSEYNLFDNVYLLSESRLIHMITNPDFLVIKKFHKADYRRISSRDYNSMEGSNTIISNIPEDKYLIYLLEKSIRNLFKNDLYYKFSNNNKTISIMEYEYSNDFYTNNATPIEVKKESILLGIRNKIIVEMTKMFEINTSITFKNWA